MTSLHALPGTDHVVAGVRLHVVSYGDGPGVPLMLLHGAPATSYVWSNVQRALGHRHASHAPDLLGCGASEAPASGRYDAAAQAEKMLGLLDTLAISRCALIAHDLGGGVAAHMAALAPERIAALVLTGTPMHEDAWPQASLAQLPRRLRSRAGELLRRAPEGGRSAGLARLTRSQDPSAVESAYRIVRAGPPDTLIVWGNDDTQLSAAYGRRIAADLAATFVPVMDVGHDLPAARPERLAEETEAWLADLPITRAVEARD